MNVENFKGYIIKNKPFNQTYNQLINLNDELKTFQKKKILDNFFHLFFSLNDYCYIHNTYSIEKNKLEDILQLKISLEFLDLSNENTVYGVIKKIFNHLISINYFDNSQNNYKFSIYFYPLNNEKTLVCPLGNQQYFEIIESDLIELEEYHYSKEMEVNENISEEELKQRKEDWEKVFPGIGKYNEFGLRFKLLDKNIELYYSCLGEEQIKFIDHTYFSKKYLNYRIKKAIRMELLEYRDDLYEEWKKLGNFENDNWIENIMIVKDSFEFKNKQEELVKKYHRILSNHQLSFFDVVKIKIK